MLTIGVRAADAPRSTDEFTGFDDMTLRRLLAAFAIAIAFVAPAAAISASDQDLLARAVDAGERKDWNALRTMVPQASDPTVSNIIRWRYLIDRLSGAGYDELYAFIAAHPTWPNAETMQRNAERAMPVNLPAANVIAFFKDRPPVSGEGMLAYGVALLESGDTTEGPIWIRRGYVAGTFSAEREAAIRTQYAAYLPPDADRLRLSALLWEDDFESANRMLAYVDSGYRALGQARLKLRTNTKGAQKFIDAVPANLRADFGLLFDLGRWYRRSEQLEAGARFMMQAQRDPAVPIPLDKWWDEKHLHVREAIKARRFTDAYNLAASAGLTEGADFAESEFLAGWMALRFLNDPNRAVAHFDRIAPSVFTPISLARGHYWNGRAREAAGDSAGATAAYQAAAVHIETFYGQLAAARIQESPTITIDMSVSDTSSTLDRDELVQAVAALSSIADTKLLPRFVGALGDGLKTREDFETAAALLLRLNRPAMSVRVAKKALQGDFHAFRFAYPIVQLPPYQGSGQAPDTAFVLALMRQESEFDPSVVSSANAYGIMQMLPETARMTANKHGIPYDGSLLLDWQYNATLGMAHLRDMLDKFGGSYVLVAIAYNAGPGRVTQWIEQFGDPRDPNVDVVDWIERIPFNETRNYVMRLLENTEVYRAMLAGGTAPLQIGQDLLVGSGRTVYVPGKMQASEALR